MTQVPKNVFFSSEARDKILRGVKILSSAVKATLGPKGRNVMIDKGFENPAITKDGITVAKSIVLKDRAEELGVRLLREAAARTGDTAGDGTTTATVLAEDIYTRGLKHITAGVDPMALRRGIDRVVPLVVGFLKKNSVPVDNPEQIRQVGTIAANGEKQIGDLLVQALTKVGNDGVVVMEEAQGFDTDIELIEGLQFDRGYLSPYFMTEVTGDAVYEDGVYILLSEKRIMLRDLIPALQITHTQNKALLIIADELAADTLNMLVLNRAKNGMKIVAVKAPGFGDRKRDLLNDIAIATGATIVSDKTGVTFEKFKQEHFGVANKVIVRREETIIVEGQGDPGKIEERAQFIRKEIEEAKQASSTIAIDFLETRLAKLTAGIARIKVGGATEAEMNERKDRVEDALHATRAAIQEGFLPGGGVPLYRAAKYILGLLGDLGLTVDEMFGAKLLLDALESPIRQIALNAGVSPELIAKEIENREFAVGYNAATGKIEDLVQAGVIDPTKVVRLELENAVSVASTMLTTECMVVEIQEEKNDKKTGGY
jgi:chaperonin GroEL